MWTKHSILRLTGVITCTCLAGWFLSGCEGKPTGADGGNGKSSTTSSGVRGGRGGFSRGPTLVVTREAEIRPINETIEAIGTTLANESVTITAKVTDTISKVKFEDGIVVQTGDVLVELTNQEETALLAEAEANVMDADTQFKRLDGLLKQGSVPASQVDEAQARLSAAEARYQSILARLDDRLVRAPFSGMLGFRNVSTGTLVSPGTAITTLDDISVIKLDFSIPEVYLGLIKPGMNLVADSAAYPEKKFPATVRTIDSRIDPITRSATVRAHIMNDALLLRPGMLMTVRITTAQRKSLMVPESALVQRSNEVFVFTVDDAGLAQMRQVKHGVRSGGWVEILTGLELGEAVISQGVIKVRQGSPVSTGPVDPPGVPPRSRERQAGG